MSASAKVFGTPELLENILIQLPMRDLLLSQRVNVTFKSAIDGSIHLQRALWSVPLSPMDLKSVNEGGKLENFSSIIKDSIMIPEHEIAKEDIAAELSLNTFGPSDVVLHKTPSASAYAKIMVNPLIAKLTPTLTLTLGTRIYHFVKIAMTEDFVTPPRRPKRILYRDQLGDISGRHTFAPKYPAGSWQRMLLFQPSKEFKAVYEYQANPEAFSSEEHCLEGPKMCRVGELAGEVELPQQL